MEPEQIFRRDCGGARAVFTVEKSGSGMEMTLREKRNLADDALLLKTPQSGPSYRNHLYHPNIFSALSSPKGAVNLAGKCAALGAVASAYRP
jgi:hypothetical protein